MATSIKSNILGDHLDLCFRILLSK